MGSVFIEFSGVGPSQTDDISRELDHGALHTEADSEERNPSFAGESDGVYFSFDPSFAESARRVRAT